MWQISDEAQKLLTLTEKYFRMKTSTLLQRKIHTKQIVTELMNYSHTKEFFNEIVSVADIDCTTEVCKNTLYSILNLYIQVRAFSYTKDIVQKQRLGKAEQRRKSLRKEILRSIEDEKRYEFQLFLFQNIKKNIYIYILSLNTLDAHIQKKDKKYKK